ncbi:unnamed protein product, partial [Polarella glacialis]
MAWGPFSGLYDRLRGSEQKDDVPSSGQRPVASHAKGEHPEWRRGQELRAHLAASAAVRNAGHLCGLVYDDSMLRHRGPDEHPERPERIAEIWKLLTDVGLVDLCSRAPSRKASNKELLAVHTEELVNKVTSSSALCARQYNTSRLMTQISQSAEQPFNLEIDDDTYLSHGSADAARTAAGSVLSLIDEVMGRSSPIHCGMAVVRPPGHHAKAGRSSGFCLFNNVAIAARYLQRRHRLQKVLIVDWDVHHGDGTSEIFSSDSDVLFFSVHRYDSKTFFPGTGHLEDAGKGPAKGFTVNVPLGQGYTDLDVCHTIRHALVPLMARFQPEFILVSAGFDAVHDDILGGCHMTPQGFGWVTRCLHQIAKQHCQGRLVLVLEGGYNCCNAARCAAECVGALVLESAGEAPLPCHLPPLPNSGSCLAATSHAQNHGQWNPCPKTASIVRKVTELHNLFSLQLPIAPKHLPGEHAKNHQKHEKHHNGGTQGRGRSDSTMSEKVEVENVVLSEGTFLPASAPPNNSKNSSNNNNNNNTNKSNNNNDKNDKDNKNNNNSNNPRASNNNNKNNNKNNSPPVSAKLLAELQATSLTPKGQRGRGILFCGLIVLLLAILVTQWQQARNQHFGSSGAPSNSAQSPPGVLLE